MISSYVHIKVRALKMRKAGTSLRSIEAKLGVPRSTLSGWLKDVQLSREQREALHKRWLGALKLARLEAARWHNAQKASRLERAQQSAQEIVTRLPRIPEVTELALALLYLGEGNKTNTQTAMGNSDPEILVFFVFCLRELYCVPEQKIKCELHLRADQDPKKLVRYWSKVLDLPRSNFMSISIDKRTLGKPTYTDYKGVCLVRCGRVDIQRKLVYIAREFCSQAPERARG